MRRLIKKLFLKLTPLVASLVEHAIHYRKSENLKKVKAFMNVNIDETMILGEYSEFNIEGDCGELIIEDCVSTRKHCSFSLFGHATLIIRKNVFFNNYCSINCLGRIEVGSDSIFGEGVKLYDHNHLYSFGNDRKLTVEKRKFDIGYIKIGSNCWIGSNVTILNNVEIGDNVIIGANCLIHKSIPSNSIVKHKEDLIIL